MPIVHIYNKNLKKSVIKAFQRRFRKELIDGILELECAKIASNLAKIIKISQFQNPRNLGILKISEFQNPQNLRIST